MIKGIIKPILVRYKFSSLQLKKSARKGCQLFSTHIEANEKKPKKQNLDEFPIIKRFKKVFAEEILALPAHRDIYFSIDLVPGATLVSKTPYRMSILELLELKMQL